jgi:putative YphP/YqiW family bacilliredoxin
MYPKQRTDPAREQALAMGLVECTTPEQVDAAIAQPGTTLVFVNSVCGCAAAAARPGLAQALAGQGPKPTRSITVFAGVDREATQQARQHCADQPPSSPSAALLRDGRLVWMLHRHQIEGRSPVEVAEQFQRAFAAHC